MVDANGRKIKSGKIMIGFGIFFIFGFFVLLISPKDSNYILETTMASMFYLIPGLILIILGNNRRKKYNLHRNYLTFFAHYPNCNFIELAQKLNKDTRIIERDLRILMANHFFPPAFIQEKLTPRNMNHGTKGSDHSGNGDYISIVCHSCNGVNKVAKHHSSDCIYCGTALTQ